MINLGIILLGILAILFRKRFTKFTRSVHFKVDLPDKYDKLANSVMEMSFLIIGIIFVIFGLLAFFDLIKMKP